MSEDDGMCEDIVRIGQVRFTCDRRLGHDGRHGGIYPGFADGQAVDVEIQWAEAAP